MKTLTALAGALALAIACLPASAETFADGVADYSPVIIAGEPTAPHREPTNALGPPDFVPGPCGATCPYVSLGDGGSLTVVFIDNSLCCSGDDSDDLFIHEIGPDVEDTFVEVSADGVTFVPVGSVGGGTSSVDLDAFMNACPTGTETYSFVRLTDDTNEGAQSGPTVGADIDAVEALCSVEVCCAPCQFLELLSMVFPDNPEPSSTDPCFGVEVPSPPSDACCDAINEVAAPSLATTHPCFIAPDAKLDPLTFELQRRPRVRQLR